MVQRENGANEMNHGSLFSGIGGFDLAAEWAGWDNIFHCEWNPFGQKILKHYWPQAHSFNDITKTDFTPYANKIDILTGGFPCQPYSSAGKRKGKEDERHLWPEMLRAIREIQPRWVVGENVLGLVNWSRGLVFHEVQADLEAEGYEVQPFLLPAAAVGAPHRRDRIWFVAHCNSTRLQKARTKQQTTRTTGGSIQGNATHPDSNGQHQYNGNNEINTSEGRINALGNIEQSVIDGNAADTNTARIYKQHLATKPNKTQQHSWRTIEGRNFSSFPTQSPICGGNDGLPAELDGITFSKWRQESIKGYGNAIVPQVAYQIFKAINEYESARMVLSESARLTH
jgi:DNA (cytosine-5)-methyltransferase 1